VTSVISRLYWSRYASRNACSWSDLESFSFLEEAQQKQLLAQLLISQLQYFGTRADALPEWRSAAQTKDPEEIWKVWPSLPVVTKKMLLDRFPASEVQELAKLPGQVKSTGGSTGEPTRFFHDVAMLRSAVAGNIYTRLKMGWKPGMAAIIIWGSERDIGRQTGTRKARTLSWMLQEYLVDGYNLSESTVKRVLELIEKRRPVAVYGFTSMLEYVARSVLQSGSRVEPGSVCAAWNGGEMLYPEQSEVFQEAFHTPILNRYGGRELSTIACQFEAGGPLNVLRPWIFLEIMNEDGKPASPGEPGRILLTSTICRGTPFLRYEIGDIGVADTEHHTSAGITALRELQGRTAGLVTLPDGRVINNLYWNHLFKEFSEVRQFQVTYKRDGVIAIRLVGNGFSSERETHFRSMTAHLLEGTPLTVEWVNEIARTKEGKLIQVVQDFAQAGKS
jgi:phenylacetate-CoA ligase